MRVEITKEGLKCRDSMITREWLERMDREGHNNSTGHMWKEISHMDRSIGLGLDIYMLVCTLVVLDRH
jgi:hypothetical protein